MPSYFLVLLEYADIHLVIQNMTILYMSVLAHFRAHMAWIKDMILEGRVELAFVGTKDRHALASVS